LWPLTERRAKPLLPLAGTPLLTHLVKRVPAGICITVSTNAVFADDMQTWMQSMRGHDVAIRIEDTNHDDKKLGALGALRAWMMEKNVHDDILLLAGDNYIGFDLTKLTSAFHGMPILAAYDLGSLKEARSYGTVVTDHGDGNTRRVKAFEEKPASPKSTLISTGCSILPKEQRDTILAFAAAHPDNIGGIFEEFLRNGTTVECMVTTDSWRDIGSFATYLDTHRDVVGDARMVDARSHVDARTKLHGSITIGPDCDIKDSTMTDCILFGNSTIDDCVLTRCIIDEGCTLRGVDLTDKMIRAGTELRRTFKTIA
jgi:glucose-1-phosphate thymidylyltransferase